MTDPRDSVRPIGVPNTKPTCMKCEKLATWVHTQYWNTGNTKGVSFWCYCDEHKPEIK